MASKWLEKHDKVSSALRMEHRRPSIPLIEEELAANSSLMKLDDFPVSATISPWRMPSTLAWDSTGHTSWTRKRGRRLLGPSRQFAASAWPFIRSLVASVWAINGDLFFTVSHA